MSATRFLLPSTRLLSRAASATKSTSTTIFTQTSRSRTIQSTSLRSQKSSFHTSPPFNMANRTLESDVISEITQKEKNLTGQADPVKGGPTAQAQSHVHEKLSDGSVVSDIAKGEEAITHNGAPVPGGPAAAAQSHAAQARNEVSRAHVCPPSPWHKHSWLLHVADRIRRRTTLPRRTPASLMARPSRRSTRLRRSSPARAPL